MTVEHLLITDKNRAVKTLILSDFEQSESLEIANNLLRKIATSLDSRQQRISDLYSWKGFKLWWIYYEWIFVKYGLVYSKYQTLFQAFDDASSVQGYVAQESLRKLLEYEAYARNIPIALKGAPPSIKVFLKQCLPACLKFGMTLLCLPFLLLLRPKLALFTSDFFSPQGSFDFRKKNIYHAFEERNLAFLECIRTLHSPQKLWSQFLKRKRPVIYLDAVLNILESFDQGMERFFPAWKQQGRLPFESLIALSVVRRRYWFNKGEILFLQILLTKIGVRSMMIASLSPRTLHLMIACKRASIKVVGIMHGVSMRTYVISEFMEAMESDYYALSNDVYGVWSEGWIDYFNRYSKVLNKKLLHVSGFLRYEPTQKIHSAKYQSFRHAEAINVLWVSEPLLEFKEAEPYLEALLKQNDFHVLFKVRPNRDIILETLRKQRPDLLEKMVVLDCPIDEAIVVSDVVVGSNSTGVLDGLRYDKPMITFKSRKWGDYFDIVDYHRLPHIYSESIEQLIEHIRNAKQIPAKHIQQLKHFFFDIHERDGGKWIVDRMQEFAQNPRKKRLTN
ncbi:MAG: hypothetical protein AABZ60_01155 [Planctomycetota bacterium]